MSNFWSWSGKVGLDELPDLESRLQGVLVPVLPPPDFITGMRSRLVIKPEVSAAPSRESQVQATMVATAGVLSGMLLLVVGIRLLIYVISALRQNSHLKTGPVSLPGVPNAMY